MLYNHFLFLVWIGLEILHPFYVSLTDIRYNPEAQRIEISQRIFWDDLEVVLAEKFKVKVDFLHPENPQELEKILETYLLEMNEILINNQVITLVYLGHEIEEDTAWFYLEGKVSSDPQSVKLRNSMLLQEFDTQQNIVNFYLHERPKSLITFRNNEWGELLFE